MKRIRIAPRPDWRETAEQFGFGFHTFDGEPYWDESAYYQFSLAQIENDLEDPTREIHEMCLDLVARVVDSEQWLEKLAIPAQYRDFVRRSWKERQPHLYGRMDLSYDGHGPAKLLETNYDTPTSLYEASIFQYLWLDQQIQRGQLPSESDQFNSLEEKLTDLFRGLFIETPFYFSSVKGSVEDRGTVEYLRDIAREAGLQTHLIDIEDIGLDTRGTFVDESNAPIRTLFKLYPWEHMFQEEFGAAIEKSGTLFIEPAWKSILSNKGALALLWELHEGHPNLLPTFFDADPTQPLANGWVRKPFFSREGANIDIRTDNGRRVYQNGPYGSGPSVLQKFHPLPCFEGHYTVIGSWMIGDQPAGIGIREDDSLITKDTSRFLPHIIR
ncbi:glutathionylspermidine synthase family protein [Pseudomonas sp. SLFW]|uniref:glutathionylspermidine synthase family protein n=1 Tax=Pseudomonas sp. SLFW TaxID=2683259 RepID=UPI0014128E56|nr:glutathionylspermidine synthase family protein [Pseudomonas sp. SLFW]NBB10506.1 glutathionylspermidine synthase family protein [Pseudomonas sp. SLFW]